MDDAAESEAEHFMPRPNCGAPIDLRVIKAAHPLLRNEQPCSAAKFFDILCLGGGQAFLSTTLVLIVPAGGAADAAAACTVAAPDDADEEPVEGKDAEPAAGVV
jgi:hypothetical protein